MMIAFFIKFGRHINAIADTDLKVVLNKGHGLGLEQVWYKKIEDAWKVGGVKPELNWAEYDFFGTVGPSEAVKVYGKNALPKTE